MGVIGRLDDQVNEIIIKPVSERHVDAEASRISSRNPAPPDESAQEKAQTRDKEKVEATELPVWLL